MSAPVTPQRKLEAISGSLGHGLPVSVVKAPTASGAGAALLAKLKAARPGPQVKAFAQCGDVRRAEI